MILDGAGEPLCVIRTTDVEIRPFGQVDERYAWVEGEGGRSLRSWRGAHIRFFTAAGNVVDEARPVVLETLELVWPVA